MENRQLRRQFLIDKPFQVNFMFKFCIVVIVSSLLVGALIFFLSQNSTTVAIENTRVVVKNTADFIMPTITAVLIIVAVFSALVVIILTLFVSHKIAGPLFRLKREINALKDGDLTRSFKIRENDQLQSLAESLNEMATALKNNHVNVTNRFNALKASIHENKSKDEIISNLKELENYINRFLV